MMCDGHVVRATVYKGGDSIDKDIVVRDSKPDVDGDIVEGEVFSIDLDDEISVAFGLDEARVVIEACQEILDRYDTTS